MPSVAPLRVAARYVHRASADDHQPEVIFKNIPQTEPIGVVLADGGVVTAADIRRLLLPQVGPLEHVRLTGPFAQRRPNVVGWQGMTPNGDIVRGQLVLHAGVARDGTTVQAWAEIVLGDDLTSESGTRTAGTDGAAEERLEQVALRVRHIVHRLREEPTFGGKELVRALVGIVDLAEGDA